MLRFIPCSIRCLRYSLFYYLPNHQPPHPCSGMRSACPSFRGTLLHICDRSIDPPLGFPPAPTTPHPVTSPPERFYWPSVAELVHSRSAQLVKRAVLIAALIAARARTSLPLHLWRFCDGLKRSFGIATVVVVLPPLPPPQKKRARRQIDSATGVAEGEPHTVQAGDVMIAI